MKQSVQKRRSGTVGVPRRQLGCVESEDRRRGLGTPLEEMRIVSSTVRAPGMGDLNNTRLRRPSYKRSSISARGENQL